MDLDHIEDLMSDAMGGDILEQNLTVLRDAYEQVSEMEHTHDLSVPTGSHDEPQVLMSGSHAIAYGAIDAGCRFISGYPMTPWTDAFTIMTQLLPDMGGSPSRSKTRSRRRRWRWVQATPARRRCPAPPAAGSR